MRTLTVALALLAPLAAHAESVHLDMRLGTPAVEAGRKQTAYLKVGLTGALERKPTRVPVNVALVIDKSGSMSGDKIRRAKDAALMAIDRLGPDDIVSVVAYDTRVSVLVPATKAGDKESIRDGIARLSPGGNTALFAGVSKGADELRKFFDRNRVNRLILLSDGLANVGPSSPGELAGLGAALGREGMTITTLGLGLDYNEDLMQGLARATDGNHVFVERPDDLVRFFDLEFGEVLSVVAQDADVRIRCEAGVRPVRVLGREADIVGNEVTAQLAQVLARQEKFVLLELELPAGEVGEERPVCQATVSYRNLETRESESREAAVKVRYVATAREAQAAVDRSVMVHAVELVSTEQNRLAVKLRDQGDAEAARRVLNDNAAWLNYNSAYYQAPKLKKLEEQNRDDAKNLDESNWKHRRKVMRRVQHQYDFQQSY
ncbi:MAG: VWA domain-containing protein [bacterium]